MLLVCALDAAAAGSKQVLLLHSYGPQFGPWNSFSNLFREELLRQSPDAIDLHEASLESARLAQISEQAPLVDYLHAIFPARDLDLIVVMGSPAARFVLQRRSQFFPAIPLLITGADQRTFRDVALSVNATVVALAVDLPKLIENILQILPDTRHIAFAAGATDVERFWAEELRRVSQAFINRATFEWFNDLSFEGMLKRAAELPPHSAIFYAGVRVDVLGVPFDYDRVLASLHESASSPIFGAFDSNLGGGIVGGPLVFSREIGRRAAAVAVRILRGEAAGTIKTTALALGPPVYDWRELQRWNISESRLPPGSSVRFREPTAWERYRWHLMAILIALSIQAAMITWLLLERRSRRRAELEGRKRLLQVMHLNRTAEAGALSASFAHELSQPLLAVMLNARTAEDLLTANPPELRKLREVVSDIRQAVQHGNDIIQSVRKLLKRRSEVRSQQFDLKDTIADAMHILSPEARERSVTLRSNGTEQPLPVHADPIHVQQVILNLATNGMDAMRDTTPDARTLVIRTTLPGKSWVEVSVSDTGTGIPKDKLNDIFATFYTTKEQGTGLGLSISRTIIETYGGKIWAENRHGGGAVVRFTLPLAQET
jgi:signal transduction histidine kinase